MKPSKTAAAIGLAAICWFFTFGITWGNFWVKMAVSIVLLCLFAFPGQRPVIRFRLRSALTGVVSAAALYALFVCGNAMAPCFISDARTQVSAIYDLGAGSSPMAVFFLLLLVTGPGEELFWRGFVQRNLMLRWGKWHGFALSTILYAGVHVFSMNLLLVMAALVAGAFWGALYLWKGDLWAVMISHSLWSAFIFTVFPVK